MRKFINSVVCAVMLIVGGASCAKEKSPSAVPNFSGKIKVEILNGNLNLTIPVKTSGGSLAVSSCGYLLETGTGVLIRTVNGEILNNTVTATTPVAELSGMSIILRCFVTNGMGMYEYSDDMSYMVPVIASSLSFAKEKVYVHAGQSLSPQLERKPLTAEDEILWSSSDESIATVDSKGVVRGIVDGTVKIEAKSSMSGLSASCQVCVGGNYYRWIGDWNVKRGNMTDTWKICRGVSGKTYRIMGVEGEDWASIVANYRADGSFDIPGQNLGTYVWSGGREMDVHLHGEVDYLGKTYICIGNYSIARAALISATSGKLTPYDFNGVKIGKQEIARFRFFTTDKGADEDSPHTNLTDTATSLPNTMEKATPVIATCAQVINGTDGTLYQVRGRCVLIEDEEYGDWFIDDGTGRVYVYTTLSEYDWNYLDIKVGNTVTVVARRTTYNSQVELKDAIVLEVER